MFSMIENLSNPKWVQYLYIEDTKQPQDVFSAMP